MPVGRRQSLGSGTETVPEPAGETPALRVVAVQAPRQNWRFESGETRIVCLPSNSLLMR